MTDRACEVCGSSGPPRTLEDVRDRVTGDTFRVVQCRTCDFARTHPIPGDLDRYYPARYRTFSPVAAIVLRSLFDQRVAGWDRAVPVPGRVLEIGAGRGWMLRSLRARGWRAVGTERSLGAAQVARAGGGGAPVFVGDLTAVRAAPLLDLVLMFHVLEHLADPLGALHGVAERLRPGGALILGLPNVASWQARVTGRHWHHLDVPRHLCHFSPRSIRRALADAGLRVTRIDVRSPEHDPLGWVLSGLDLAGFEQGILLKVLTREPRRSGPVATALAILLAVPMSVLALIVVPVSWAAGRGAVMEVWAVRDQR